MALCAVNCYSQWFAGLSCPWWVSPEHPELGERPIRRERPMIDQYRVAKRKLLRYNFIVITEKLSQPGYAEAAERFFGVPGIDSRARHPWCEVDSHHSNEKIPLEINPVTMKNLTALNSIDIHLYNEIKGCLDDGGEYDFPKWDPTRFESNETIRMNYHF
eukprot:364185_1